MLLIRQLADSLECKKDSIESDGDKQLIELLYFHKANLPLKTEVKLRTGRELCAEDVKLLLKGSLNHEKRYAQVLESFPNAVSFFTDFRQWGQDPQLVTSILRTICASENLTRRCLAENKDMALYLLKLLCEKPGKRFHFVEKIIRSGFENINSNFILRQWTDFLLDAMSNSISTARTIPKIEGYEAVYCLLLHTFNNKLYCIDDDKINSLSQILESMSVFQEGQTGLPPDEIRSTGEALLSLIEEHDLESRITAAMLLLSCCHQEALCTRFLGGILTAWVSHAHRLSVKNFALLSTAIFNVLRSSSPESLLSDEGGFRDFIDKILAAPGADISTIKKMWKYTTKDDADPVLDPEIDSETASIVENIQQMMEGTKRSAIPKKGFLLICYRVLMHTQNMSADEAASFIIQDWKNCRQFFPRVLQDLPSTITPSHLRTFLTNLKKAKSAPTKPTIEKRTDLNEFSLGRDDWQFRNKTIQLVNLQGEAEFERAEQDQKAADAIALQGSQEASEEEDSGEQTIVSNVSGRGTGRGRSRGSGTRGRGRGRGRDHHARDRRENKTLRAFNSPS